jgi:HEAT repeat protein
MRWIVVLTLVFAVTGAARADEADDVLARRMVGVVKDFRQPTATRAEAARTLAKLGPRASAATTDLIAVLERLRGDEQEPLQEAVIDALGQIGAAAKGALPSLAKATARTVDIDHAIKRSTELILSASDSQDIDLLTQQLLSRDASLRVRAAKALGDLGPAARSAVPVLVTALTDTDNDARRAVIAALRLIQPNAKPTEAFIKAIAVDLRDPDASYRLLAARALGRIGSPAAIVAPDLDAARGDPDPDVRRAVAEAAARVNVPAP